MAITLGTYTLPNLVWIDEFSWSPIVQSFEYSIEGSLLLTEYSKLAGRPITLVGQQDGNSSSAWMLRSDLLALNSALLVPGAEFLLTLLDTSTHNVTAVRGGDGPIKAVPIPIVGSMWPVNPGDSYYYKILEIRLIEV